MATVLLNQQAGQVLGMLEPRQEMTLTLDLIAVVPGIQAIQGIMLFDRVAGQPHELTTLPPLFIEEDKA